MSGSPSPNAFLRRLRAQVVEAVHEELPRVSCVRRVQVAEGGHHGIVLCEEESSPLRWCTYRWYESVAEGGRIRVERRHGDQSQREGEADFGVRVRTEG